MASSFITDTSHYGKKFTITFTTDNKEHYYRVLETARECVDDGSVKQKIEHIDFGDLHLRKQVKLDDAMLQISGQHPIAAVKARCMCEEYVKRYEEEQNVDKSKNDK